MVRSSQLDKADFLAEEGLFTLGSGYLHLRGSLEEPIGEDPQNVTFLRMPGNVTAEKFAAGRQKWGIYVPGVYGQHPLLRRQMVNLPFFAGLTLEVAGERLDTASSRLRAHERRLDLREARIERELTWETAGGAVLTVRFERFVSAARRQLTVQRLTVAADRATDLRITSGIDADVRTGGYDHLVARSLATRGGTVTCETTTDTGIAVRVVCGHRGVDAAAWAAQAGERAATVSQVVRLAPGVPLVLEKLSAVSTSRDLPGLAPADAVVAGAPDHAALLAEHAAVWARRWDACDVEIGGSPADQLALRVSLYHLLRSHVPDDPRVAIEPKGYAGDAYYGRFFWDTEMYLLPFFLYTDPERARTLVDFRTGTLAGARENAAAYGYPGARFAWESDDAGRENCAAWQYADHEAHVTADVVYALAHYDRACPGSGCLAGAAETLVETCRYWIARMDTRPGDGHPSLLGVMGPDEYAPITHNNAYTNFLVKFALRLAAGDLGGRGGASAAERDAFLAAAGGLAVPRSAENPRLILQCEGFDRLARPRFDELWRDRSRPYAAQVSQERLYRSQNLKQADVLMLMMLFPNDFTREELRAAWDYYVPVTTHDSSLSAGAHAILACRLGLRGEAWKFWEMSSRIDIDGGAAQGIHIASCGVNWQIAVFGFAGIGTAMESDVLRVRPQLPAAWTRLTFPLVWKGVPLRVELDRAVARVENRGARPVEVELCGGTHVIPPGEARAARRAPVRGVIFDLDGVIVSTDACHYRGWKRVADEEGIPFSEQQGERCRGVSRMESLAIVLENAPRRYSEEEKAALAARKNGYYLELVRAITPADLLPGVRAFLDRLRALGVAQAVGSSSRNTPVILAQTGLAGWFDAVADGNDIRRSKPDPEVFLLAAQRLGLEPAECVVVEDADAGVEAALTAGMRVIAVGAAAGHPRADLSAPGLGALDPAAIATL